MGVRDEIINLKSAVDKHQGTVDEFMRTAERDREEMNNRILSLNTKVNENKVNHDKDHKEAGKSSEGRIALVISSVVGLGGLIIKGIEWAGK